MITLSSWSIPRISSCLPGITLALFRSLASLLYRISLISELLPEPETPVMQVITPSGISTSICFRLFSAAPLMVRKPVGSLRTSGTGILRRPLKYAPVTELSFFIRSSAVPMATSCPPCSPAPGPISITQSAARIVSSSCSTTIRLLPRSRRRISAPSSLSLSLW